MVFSFLRHSCRSHAWRLLPHHLRRVGSLFQAGFLHPSWSCMLPIFTNLSRHPSSACFLPPPKVSSLSNQTMLSKSILYKVLIPFLFLSSKDAKSLIRWPRLQHQPLPPPWCLLHFSDSFRFPPEVAFPKPGCFFWCFPQVLFLFVSVVVCLGLASGRFMCWKFCHSVSILRSDGAF